MRTASCLFVPLPSPTGNPTLRVVSFSAEVSARIASTVTLAEESSVHVRGEWKTIASVGCGQRGIEGRPHLDGAKKIESVVAKLPTSCRAVSLAVALLSRDQRRTDRSPRPGAGDRWRSNARRQIVRRQIMGRSSTATARPGTGLLQTTGDRRATDISAAWLKGKPGALLGSSEPRRK